MLEIAVGILAMAAITFYILWQDERDKNKRAEKRTRKRANRGI